MGLILVFWAAAVAAYGVWYGLFANEFRAVHRWTGKTKYKYRPSWYQRIIVTAVSLTILIAAVAELLRSWKAN